MKSYFPFLEWLKSYQKTDFQGDLIAGLTVGIMLIPQGMAYAMLAGLPPIYGLYASIVPLIIYALMGTSRQLAVGPVAMIALLISSGVGELAALGTETFIGLAILLALMVGLIQFGMGVFRMGFMVNFLSHPVIVGFTSAAAIIIGFSQMKHLLGIDIPRGKVHETLISIIESIGQINLYALTLGGIAIFILIFIKKINRKIPAPLIVVVGSILLVQILELTTVGVKIVGDIPSGLPAFIIPNIQLSSIQQLMPTALAIAFIGYMESVAVAKTIQKKHNNYKLDNNQELLALGSANLIGSFFQVFPVTGGFSRTAVNDQAGAKTGIASIISASLIVLTLLFFTHYFYALPNTVLSAIILVAVSGLIDIKEAKHLWKTDKKDFALFMITALGTLVLGVEEGILLGVVLSIIVVVYHISYPHVAILGKAADADIYRNVERFEGLQELEDTLIIRFDARLYFANINYFKSFILENIYKNKGIKNVILDAKSINGMDSSAIYGIQEVLLELQKDGIKFYWVDVKGPIRDRLKKSGLFKDIGEHCIFNTIQEAVNCIQKRDVLFCKKKYALQTSLN